MSQQDNSLEANGFANIEMMVKIFKNNPKKHNVDELLAKILSEAITGVEYIKQRREGNEILWHEIKELLKTSA